MEYFSGEHLNKAPPCKPYPPEVGIISMITLHPHSEHLPFIVIFDFPGLALNIFFNVSNIGVHLSGLFEYIRVYPKMTYLPNPPVEDAATVRRTSIYACPVKCEACFSGVMLKNNPPEADKSPGYFFRMPSVIAEWLRRTSDLEPKSLI
jgi:hypothetical protein